MGLEAKERAPGCAKSLLRACSGPTFCTSSHVDAYKYIFVVRITCCILL